MLAFFQEYSQAHNLMGNHERKHMRATPGELQLALSQHITCYQLGDEAYAEDGAYMSGLPL